MSKMPEFAKWIRTQPLQPTSQNLYIRAVNSLVNTCGQNPSLEKVNIFVAKRARKRQAYMRYAAQHYLRFLGRDEDAKNIVKVKNRKPKRQRHYYTKEQLLDIAKNIKSEDNRVAFYLQMYTCTRAREILTITKGSIKDRGESMKIVVMGKRDSPRPVFIFKEQLVKWLRARCLKLLKSQYIFLAKGTENLPEHLKEIKATSAYKRYLENLQDACEVVGLERIGTHDLRRIFSEWMRGKVDPGKGKHAGGWQDETMLMKYWNDMSAEDDAEAIMLAAQQ